MIGFGGGSEEGVLLETLSSFSPAPPILPFPVSSVTPEADPDNCHQITVWTSGKQVPFLVRVTVSLTHSDFSSSMLILCLRISFVSNSLFSISPPINALLNKVGEKVSIQIISCVANN